MNVENQSNGPMNANMNEPSTSSSAIASKEETTDAADVPQNAVLSEEALEKLVSGVVNQLTPDFKQAQDTLQDLTKNQLQLIDTVTAENKKFDECEAFKEVLQVMEKAKLYQNKLLHIKKDMVMLHEKSAKLKKRALKLQQQKQKEALEKEANREKELEKERMLVAQPASGPS